MKICRCGARNEDSNQFCTGCGAPFKKNTAAIAGMWVVIGAILFLFVQVLGLLMSMVGLVLGLLGLNASKTLRSGRGQALFCIIGGGLLVLISIVVNIGLRGMQVKDRAFIETELQALNQVTVSDELTREELDSYIERCEPLLEKKFQGRDEVEENCDKARRLRKKRLAEETFSMQLEQALQTDIEAMLAEDNPDVVKDRKAKIALVLNDAGKYESFITEEQLAQLKDFNTRLSERIKGIEETAYDNRLASITGDDPKLMEVTEKLERVKELTKKVTKEYNEFDDYTWIRHKTYPTSLSKRDYVQVYFQLKDGKAQNLRLRLNYKANSWVFAELYKIKTDDNRYQFGGHSEHEVVGGGIVEYYDKPVSDDKLDMLYDMAKSRETKIRYEGDDHYGDREVSSQDKMAMLEMLEFYELVKDFNDLEEELIEYKQ